MREAYGRKLHVPSRSASETDDRFYLSYDRCFFMSR